MTEIAVYDGNDTIGGNKIYVDENGKEVFLYLTHVHMDYYGNIGLDPVMLQKAS